MTKKFSVDVLEYYRKYQNGFEFAVITDEQSNMFVGYRVVIKENKDLLRDVLTMTMDSQSSESKKLALLWCNHPDQGIRHICSKVINGETFNVEDRSHVPLN